MTKPIVPIRDAESEQFKPTEAQKYWMRMEEAAVYEEPHNFVGCHFRPDKPHHLAAISGQKLIIFETTDFEAVAVCSRFKAPLCSVKYRADGALLGVSTQNGQLQFFDVHTNEEKAGSKSSAPRKPIRTFKAHSESPICAFDYSPSGLRVASFGEDGFVKCFDLATDQSKPVWSSQAHSSQIRTGAFSPRREHLLATGSYDQTVRLWDTREAGDQPKTEFQHGAPVEQVMFLPNRKNWLLSAGGQCISFWDVRRPDKVLHRVETHRRTITSFCLATDGANLLTAGMDRRVNVVGLAGEEIDGSVFSIKVDSPVLSLAMDAEDECMAVSLGTRLAIYKRKPEQDEEEEERQRRKEGKRRRKHSSGKFSNEPAPLKVPKKEVKEEEVEEEKEEPPEHLELPDVADEPVAAPPVVKQRLKKPKAEVNGPVAAMVYERERGDVPAEKIAIEYTQKQLEQTKLGPLDYLLREGGYKELLRKALLTPELSPDYVVAVLQQVRIRQQLGEALAGQERPLLEKLTIFLQKHLLNEPYFDTLLEVAHKMLDMYLRKPIGKFGKRLLRNQSFKQSLLVLAKLVEEEVKERKAYANIVGTLKMLFNSVQTEEEDEQVLAASSRGNDVKQEEEGEKEVEDDEEEDEEEAIKMEVDERGRGGDGPINNNNNVTLRKQLNGGGGLTNGVKLEKDSSDSDSDSSGTY